MMINENRQWLLDIRPTGKLTGKSFAGTRVPEALGRWHREGRLVQKEDVAVGLENAPQTLMRLFTGENLGKQLLKIADVEI